MTVSLLLSHHLQIIYSFSSLGWAWHAEREVSQLYIEVILVVPHLVASPLLRVLLLFYFVQEFSDFLSLIMLQYDRALILGDFNINVCCLSSSSFTLDFIKLLDSFDLTQYVKQPTHDKGHMLDLVLSHHGCCVDDINDHNAVLFQVPLFSLDSKPSTLIRSCPLNSLSVPCFWFWF